MKLTSFLLIWCLVKFQGIENVSAKSRPTTSAQQNINSISNSNVKVSITKQLISQLTSMIVQKDCKPIKDMTRILTNLRNQSTGIINIGEAIEMIKDFITQLTSGYVDSTYSPNETEDISEDKHEHTTATVNITAELINQLEDQLIRTTTNNGTPWSEAIDQFIEYMYVSAELATQLNCGNLSENENDTDVRDERNYRNLRVGDSDEEIVHMKW